MAQAGCDDRGVHHFPRQRVRRQIAGIGVVIGRRKDAYLGSRQTRRSVRTRGRLVKDRRQGGGGLLSSAQRVRDTEALSNSAKNGGVLELPAEHYAPTDPGRRDERRNADAQAIKG